jgi:Domain of unknown function (DUF4133)
LATYKINKGINKPVEFHGLKAQYLVYFFLGLIGVFLAFTILYIIGLSLYACVGFAFVAASLLVHFIFKWNRVSGQHGLMKRSAAGRRPDYLVNRGRYLKFIRYKG